ncbi:DUF2142 domain-containing protein [Leifsonia shinshuensis]|uniref:DUF2142 domain-containing protein n=1 Tax=Leifsonia shinshuensis TaxID=150026 RepID=UPI00285AD6BB|nr:DUF2142 domain-containing protein [Leifsonia shinshuensis]MDR6973257.1 hypothetical protein [Leifsonia shinshuensis]
MASTADGRATAAAVRTPWPASRVFSVVWALLSALSAVWALATPISGSPDEPAHIVRAASVVRGELVGTPSADGHVVTVPRYIADTQRETCFAFHPRVTANCPVADHGDPGALTSGTTTAGLYNPLYYYAVGWPSLLFSTDAGIYAMRIVSGILSSLFAALALLVLWRRDPSPFLVLGFAVAVTPLTLFLNGSVNPNGLEATATLAVFAGVLSIVRGGADVPLGPAAAVVAAAGFVAVNARGLSPLWVLLAVVLPLVLLDRRALWSLLRRRAVLIAAAVVAAGTIAALAWTLGSNSLLNAVDHPESTPQRFAGVGTNFFSGFFITMERTVEYAHGVIGLFGWLDTPAPPEVFFVWTALIGALLLAAFSLLRSRALLLAVLLLASFVLLPPLVQGVYITGGGVIWQGRYVLPLFLCLIVGLAVLLGGRVPFTPEAAPWRRLSWIVVVALAVAQFYAFENTLRRYSVGDGGSLKAFLLGSPPWAPPGGNLVLLVLFAALVAAGAWLALRSVLRVRHDTPTPLVAAGA